VEIQDKIRGIGIVVVWSIWCISCLIWEVDTTKLSTALLGGLFHIGFYIATAIGFCLGGWWFLAEGADELGEWWENRKEERG